MSLRKKLKDIEDVSVNLLLTRQCPFSCDHCMYASSPTMPSHYMRNDDINAIRDFLEVLTKNLSPDTNFSINLVGGEPTLNMERFTEILEIVRNWRLSYQEDTGEHKHIQMEMTTNGWWLESYKTTVAFAQAVRQALLNEDIVIRISNSIYHDKFRKAHLLRLFEERPISFYAYDKAPSPLENFLVDLYPEETCCGTDVYPGEECSECSEIYDPLLQGHASIETLIKAIKDSQVFIDSKMNSGKKVSPVGRAKMLGFGTQDGSCHETTDVKFTFMPTKEGERPGRIYDVCCNGGHVSLGYADEGMNLFFKRMLFMQDLHKSYPIQKVGLGNNAGQGERCRNCPSFGNKWIKNNEERIKRILLKETKSPKQKPALV